jgi:acyl-CoA thioesterase-1
VWVGLVLIAFSATPWPWWVYALLTGVTVSWLLAEANWPAGRRVLRGVVLVAWGLGTAIEVKHHLPLRVSVPPGSRITIFGDSITAGTGEPQIVTWPRLLAKRHGLQIDDRSQMGASVATAIRKLEAAPASDGLILIEIGGNDLLGGTSPERYERDLSQLLAHLDRPGRTLVMFELPLPPGYNRFGQIQRRHAAQHGMHLIPKWQFLHVLTTAHATEDGLHLTQPGQERMAELVESVIGP